MNIFSILDSLAVTPIEAIDETGLVDVAAVLKEVNSIDSKRNFSYTKWNEKDRHSIRKYLSDNGAEAAVRKFKKEVYDLERMY